MLGCFSNVLMTFIIGSSSSSALYSLGISRLNISKYTKYTKYLTILNISTDWESSETTFFFHWNYLFFFLRVCQKNYRFYISPKKPVVSHFFNIQIILVFLSSFAHKFLFLHRRNDLFSVFCFLYLFRGLDLVIMALCKLLFMNMLSLFLRCFSFIGACFLGHST